MDRENYKALAMRRGRHGNLIRVYGDALVTGESGVILVASLFGRQAQLKAMVAALRGNNKMEFWATFQTPRHDLFRCEEGYDAYKNALGYGYWQVLLVAKVPGLILALGEESLWRELRSDRFTTPILRRWVPWLLTRLREAGGLAKLTQGGCNAGLLTADDELLDKLVSEGLQTGALTIGEEYHAV